MKKLICAFTLLAVASTALAVDKEDLDRKLAKLTSKFEAMQAKSSKRVPADKLSKAEAILILDRTKAGFIFAYQGGGGVAITKDKKSGKWGPVAFYRASEGSLGFQIGGQQSFLVILMMSAEGTKLLTDPNFEFGGEARGTAGDQSAGVEGSVSDVERPILIYDDREGLFGGAAIKGGSLSPDETANRVYYDEAISVKEILFEKKVQPTEAAKKLAEAIQENTKEKKES